MYRKKSKQPFSRLLKLIVFSLIFFIGWKVFLYSKKPERVFENNNAYQKTIYFNDDGIETKLKTKTNTVGDFLLEQNISLKEQDEIFPSPKTTLFSGNNIRLNRAVKIKILVDGKKIENYTLSKNLLLVFAENNVTLGRLDKTAPEKNGLIYDGLEIIVTRINVEEKIIPEDIDFKSKTKMDSKLGWREKKTETKGEKGVREIKYKITYKDGKEVSRVVLEKTVTKEPVTEVIVQGTYVKIGKAHKGQGTWYSFKGGLYAASPWLPIGSFAKVTNTQNGKSVMVEINDRGPFGKGRIIDLDKQAFEKIASIGAGVIGVKVEEVLN